MSHFAILKPPHATLSCMWRLFELNYNDFSLNLSEKFPSRYMIANCHILKSHFCTSLNFEIVSVLITLLRITSVIMRDPCHFNQDVRHKNFICFDFVQLDMSFVFLSRCYQHSSKLALVQVRILQFNVSTFFQTLFKVSKSAAGGETF